MQGKTTVLVTGADGFLGSNIVRVLLDGGYRVRAMVEPSRRTGSLDGLAVDESRGDLLDPAFVAESCRGVDAVIHTVASTAVWPSRDPWMRSLNVDAAMGLARAAEAAARDREAGGSAMRFVHVGTANSFASGSAQMPGDESGPYDAGHFGLDYQDTKREAQELLLAMSRPPLEVIVVNPTFMFGPWDSKPGSGAMILALAKRGVPGSSPGGRSFADVRAVARGTVAALERGIPGDCYILGGENLSYAQVFAEIAAVLGRKPPRARMPRAAVLAFGALGSLAASLTGKAPQVSLAMARIACETQYYSSAKATRELGYAVAPIGAAIAAACEWFRSRGML